MPRRDPRAAEEAQRQYYRDLGFCVLEGIEGGAQPPAAAPADAPTAAPAAPAPARSDLAGPVPGLLDGPALGPEERIAALDAIRIEVAGCQGCRLAHSRTNTVPGEGDPMAELMFVGEGPGASEDEQGRPFVGRSGELLTKIIEAMQFRREEVYIANVVKCRPPGNRQPESDEMETCLPYLQRQIAIIRPRAMVALGKTALMGLLPEHRRSPITRIRGEWLDFGGIPLMPTFHPAYLLRSPNQKKFVWEDMQKVMALFGKKPAK